MTHRVFLQPVEVIKVEVNCQFVYHSFQGDKGCNNLEDEEEGKDDIN